MNQSPVPHIHVPYDRLWEHLDLIRSERFSIELFINGGNIDAITPEKLDELRDALSGVPSLSVHGPFMDLSPGAVDSSVREATLSRFNRALDIAGAIGANTVVFHSGYEKWKYALRTDIWLEQSLLTWRSLASKAKALGLRIAIENIFEDEPQNLRQLMEALNDPVFGICFDTGHCNLFTKVPLSEWLDSLGPYIIELHLHDNSGEADAHLPMGEGSFDFEMLFSKLSLDGIVPTIEAHNIDDVRTALERFGTLTG